LIQAVLPIEQTDRQTGSSVGQNNQNKDLILLKSLLMSLRLAVGFFSAGDKHKKH